MGLAHFIPVLCGMVTFTVYDVVYPDDPLSIPQVILIMNIFSNILSTIRLNVGAQLSRANAKVSSHRINTLMKVEKYEKLVDSPDLELGVIEIENASFAFDDPKYEKLFGETAKKSKKTPS